MITEKPQILCDLAVDIGFLVDSSQYKPEDFAQVKGFVKRIVNGFAVEGNTPRAGLVSFGSAASFDIPFFQYASPKTFNAALDRVAQSGGTRRIDKGIALAFDELFTKFGARPNVPQLLFLITTGRQSKESGYRQPKFVAEYFHEVGNKIMAVGIGPDVDQEELIGITKDKNNVHLVQNFKDLAKKTFSKKITKAACLASGETFDCIFMSSSFFVPNLLCYILEESLR